MSETTFAAGYQSAEPAPAAEPVAEPVAEWAGPTQEEWSQQQEALNYLIGQFQPEPEAPGAQYAGIDPFSESFGSQLAEMIGQAVQQYTQPLTEWQYGQQLSEAHDRALDILEDDVSRNGEFMLGSEAFAAVEALANSYMPELAQKMGYGPQAAEAALAKAAGEWRAYEAKLAEAAVARHMNQLSTLGGAPREPLGAQVGAAQGLRTPAGGDELSVVSGFGGFPGRS